MRTLATAILLLGVGVAAAHANAYIVHPPRTTPVTVAALDTAQRRSDELARRFQRRPARPSVWKYGAGR